MLLLATGMGCRKSSNPADADASSGGQPAAVSQQDRDVPPETQPAGGGEPSGMQQATRPVATTQHVEAVRSEVSTQPEIDLDPNAAPQQVRSMSTSRRSPIARPLREPDSLQALKRKPLHQFNEREVDVYLRYLSRAEPNLISRLMHLARKNIGQPYELYLLGEFPYETYDPDPMYCLAKGDCVTFCEHTYAMALSRDWASFFQTLQRLRYKDGQVSILTRNHETVCDWDRNNAWLFTDATALLAGENPPAAMNVLWRPGKFFGQFGIGQDLPDVRLTDAYIPRQDIPKVADGLRDGDFVNVIRGDKSYQWCGHVGIIGRGSKGQVHLIHSTSPVVREELLADYLARNGSVLGFKFFRLKDNPQQVVDREVRSHGIEPPAVPPPRTSSVKPGGNAVQAATKAKQAVSKAKPPQRTASRKPAASNRR